MLGNNFILSNFATAYYFLRNKYCCVLRAGSWIGGWTYRAGVFARVRTLLFPDCLDVVRRMVPEADSWVQGGFQVANCQLSSNTDRRTE